MTDTGLTFRSYIKLNNCVSSKATVSEINICIQHLQNMRGYLQI